MYRVLHELRFLIPEFQKKTICSVSSCSQIVPRCQSVRLCFPFQARGTGPIERWAKAVREENRKAVREENRAGIRADHDYDILMFDIRLHLSQSLKDKPDRQIVKELQRGRGRSCTAPLG
jgi:hypothetical protein